MSVLLNTELSPKAVFAAVTFLARKDHHPFAIRASVSGARSLGFQTEFESEGDYRSLISCTARSARVPGIARRYASEDGDVFEKSRG